MPHDCFIGLMSGTSMDGVDGVLARFDEQGNPAALLAKAHEPFDPDLRAALFALQSAGENELEREALAGLALADVYARCCATLLHDSKHDAIEVSAIGVHGQTIRHRPELGYTRQVNQPARLAELTGIDVIADFRSRDVAAGGQGAPLVPAFHATVFGAPDQTRVICNIGGISNISILKGRTDVRGFDCGPGNVLMDVWADRMLGVPYDAEGRLAATGTVDTALLSILLAEPYFSLAPPKSTGRDLFNAAWLDNHLARHAIKPEDVQATLTALTAHTIAQDIGRHAAGCQAVYICGGGARNPVLMAMLKDALARFAPRVTTVVPTDGLGVDSQQVEALAFAWLAQRFVSRQPGNLSAVTGAKGPRVLGALYPR